MNIIDIIKKEMHTEAEAIKIASEKIDVSIEKAVHYILQCKGKVVTTGMGKSGLIARKISATFASTGTTSIFLHPAEGIHGDLGMLQKGDVVLALSHSGNTQELISIIPYIKFNKIPLISITGNVTSNLAKNSDVVIDSFVDKECEPFGLVPTASTTVQLSIGDALAVSVLKMKDFKVTDFALFHPGGTIGKKLLLKVADLMHTGKANPIVTDKENMQNVILEMTSKGLGCTNVIDDDGKLVGIVTDGDLRRFLSLGLTDLNINVKDAMTVSPKRMTAETLAVEALNLMEECKITMLPIIDQEDKPIGILHMHDLIKSGVVS
ncbi:MAG: KpsF/GutQ family sugar-phosphate isomerase [Candidatus Cloacimonetes bacterium]|jgi:arabinose-5-phosphate isomerase|nr:KpsF/GutQ family sugar-phosphate isomerase [Candidatus Cloacimonadota bacterium]MDD4155769.1 KpsF/GutQ family sugar-phosphate isomerase [Candidatus Cloacimonadota bacterium]